MVSRTSFFSHVSLNLFFFFFSSSTQCHSGHCWPFFVTSPIEKETNGTWGNERYGPSLLCLCCLWRRKETRADLHRAGGEEKIRKKKWRKTKLWKKLEKRGRNRQERKGSRFYFWRGKNKEKKKKKKTLTVYVRACNSVNHREAYYVHTSTEPGTERSSVSSGDRSCADVCDIKAGAFFFFSSPLLSHLFYVQQCVPDVLLKWIGRRCRPLTKSRRRLLRPEWRNRPRPTAANLTRSNLAANSDWLANANITTTHSNRFLWIASRVAAVAPMEGGCRCVKSSATAGCTLCRSRRWRTSTTPFAWRSARKIWPSVSDWSTNTPSVTSSKTIWVRKFAFSIRCLS